MKAFALVPLSLAVLSGASPLGNRLALRKHKGTPHLGVRYRLESRVDAPPACAAINLPPSNTTSPAADNSTVIDPLTADNSTSADDSTSPDNSTTTSLTRRRPRFWRRIAQDDLPNVAQSWQDLCLVSGGDIFTNEPCVNLAGIFGINALLANADPCAQQDNADAMITFAKSTSIKNANELIANAIAYRKHPRNAIEILGIVPSTLYCQRAPENPELVGVVNEQLDGVDPGIFGSPNIPLVPFGARKLWAYFDRHERFSSAVGIAGTCPFGLTPNVTTCTCVNGTDATGAANATDINSSNGTDTNATATATNDGSADATSTSAASDATASADATGTEADNATATDAAADSATIDDLTSTVAAPTPAATSAVATPTAKAGGPNFQPADISGDVNDING